MLIWRLCSVTNTHPYWIPLRYVRLTLVYKMDRPEVARWVLAPGCYWEPDVEKSTLQLLLVMNNSDYLLQEIAIPIVYISGIVSGIQNWPTHSNLRLCYWKLLTCLSDRKHCRTKCTLNHYSWSSHVSLEYCQLTLQLSLLPKLCHHPCEIHCQ